MRRHFQPSLSPDFDELQVIFEFCFVFLVYKIPDALRNNKGRKGLGVLPLCCCAVAPGSEPTASLQLSGGGRIDVSGNELSNLDVPPAFSYVQGSPVFLMG